MSEFPPIATTATGWFLVADVFWAVIGSSIAVTCWEQGCWGDGVDGVDAELTPVGSESGPECRALQLELCEVNTV